jgi:hypothetical protein
MTDAEWERYLGDDVSHAEARRIREREEDVIEPFLHVVGGDAA